MNSFDCVVVGAGPAGSTVGRKLARAGFDVLIIDKRQELGAPIQCSGAISRHALVENSIDPDAEFIHEEVYGFRVMDLHGGDTCIDYRTLKPESYGSESGKSPLGYVVDRRRFDRHLLTLAERDGAKAWLKAEALAYSIEKGGARISIRHFNDIKEVSCKVVVGADGLQSQVGKWAGIRTHIKLNELASCLQVVVDGVETDGLLELVTGSDVAPGGYAWVFPKGHGYAEIGLGVIAGMTRKNAQWHLNAFMKNSSFSHRFRKARILEIQGGGVPLAAPLKKQYADNMILVGDAARHVNPITGGGLHTALSGGRIAADFLVEHFHSSSTHEAIHLAAYQDAWLQAIGDKMWKLYGIKKRIFQEKDRTIQDQALYRTMSAYFSPNSEFKKI